MTGYYVVGTTEEASTDPNIYDQAVIDLLQEDGTLIETALLLSNLNNGAAYAPFTHSFAVGGLSGQTVRLALASENDDTNYTNFFFDTLALTANYCH